jgi:hypothetical protein
VTGARADVVNLLARCGREPMRIGTDFRDSAKRRRLVESSRRSIALDYPAFLVISVLYYAFKFKMIHAQDLSSVKFIQISNQTYSCQKISG